MPGVEIHVATKAAFAALWRDNPRVRGLHLLGSSLGDLIRQLRKEHFDLILDLHNNLRSALVRAGMPEVASRRVDKLSLAKWRYVHGNRSWKGARHIVQRYLDTLSVLGVHDDGLGLEFYTGPEAEQALDLLPPSWRETGYDVLVLGARQVTKRPTQALLESIVQHAPRPLVLVGGPEDRRAGEALAALQPDKTMLAAGQTSLQGSAVLIRECSRVLSPDTGMMHIAAAYQKPIGSIWGNTTPLLGMYPYYGGPDPQMRLRERGSALFEVSGLACRPCSHIGFEHCPKGHFRCMREQQPAAMTDWLRG